ncbi:MAG: hypothetical protein MUF21_00255 [Gemmatimonadaceae bacterium]|nr:hypothetical protein [Gemmatimonadaceae bacterium]
MWRRWRRCSRTCSARFLPAGDLDARALVRRPRDPWLLVLRVLVLALLGLGAAQCVPAGESVRVRRVVLLDARASEGARMAAVRGLDARDAVIDFDTAARVQSVAAWRADSMARRDPPDADSLARAWRDSVSQARPASAVGKRFVFPPHPPVRLPRRFLPSRLDVALAVLARIRDSLARDADTLAFTVVSPFHADAVTAATRQLRALLPERLAMVRVASAAPAGDTTPGSITMLYMAPALPDDPVAAGIVPRVPGGARVTLGRTTFEDGRDSTATRILWMPAPDSVRADLDAVRLDDGTVWVAPLARGRRVEPPLFQWTNVIAWWRDGSPAAVELRGPHGGCTRFVEIGLPSRGDAAITPEARHAIARLARPCDAPVPVLDDRALAALAAAPGALTPVTRATLVTTQRAVWAPWLVGAAALLAAVEPLLRRRLTGRREVAATDASPGDEALTR